MSHDPSGALRLGGLLACLQTVFPQQHSVLVLVTVGWQRTIPFHEHTGHVYTTLLSAIVVVLDAVGCSKDPFRGDQRAPADMLPVPRLNDCSDT